MNKTLVRAGSIVSTAALVFASFVQTAAAITIDINGNGASSNNTINVSTNNSVNVSQNNSANITNNVDVDADTGHNDANNNTGGDVSINTGDATGNVGVHNNANSNFASVNACCPNDVNVTINGNGAYSDNDVTLNTRNKVKIDQDNRADVENNIDVNSTTGYNDANKNTGGDVSITTGDASGNAQVTNALNRNGAVVGNNGTNNGGSLSILISGNGANSDNNVAVLLTSNVDVDQNNTANVTNNVDVDADTGHNDANNNTGGDVTIDTGDASGDVDVMTEANLNWADVNACGCFLNEDSSIRVKGNGADTDNDVTLNVATLTRADQDNRADVDNNVDDNEDTGYNDANNNTTGGEPGINTGDASANKDVDTSVNSNVVGSADVEFPNLPSFPEDSHGSASFLFWLWTMFNS